jgi:hypothetical protein
VGNEVVIRSVTFAGQDVGIAEDTVSNVANVAVCAAGRALSFRAPVRLQVIAGIQVPLRLDGIVTNKIVTPIITPDGTLYAPKGRTSDVFVFAADGTPLPPLPGAALGLYRTRSAAFVDGPKKVAGTLLLLADDNYEASVLVAVDSISRAVRWSTALGGSCYGIAVLPAQGVVVVSYYSHKSYDNDSLRAHRLSDGSCIARVNVVEPSSIAADLATATLYVSTLGEVFAYHWDGASLVFDGFVDAAGDFDDWRPLAVVPPAPGEHSPSQHSSGLRTSYLVVGTYCSSTLRVLSLPDRRLVQTYELEGMKVMGLAADPSGTALAVCDAASKAIHVLPWPLFSMSL